jgi:hypothetical protein
MPFWETDPLSFKFPQLSEFTDSELARHGMTRHQAHLLDAMFSNANTMAVKFIADALLELVDLVKPQMALVQVLVNKGLLGPGDVDLLRAASANVKAGHAVDALLEPGTVEETTEKIRAWVEKFTEINRGPGH